MDSMDDQYGFEATFISDVPEYLKCVICQLVLRKPLQIIKCGHKFCSPCFHGIKSYSENFNTSLVCPIDRDVIDMNKVFEDNGMNRVIGDLMVKCSNNTTECLWTGELRDLKVHEEQCEHRVVHKSCDSPNVQKVEESSSLLKEMYQRMTKFEDDLMEKDKDIAFLKFSLQEVKKQLDEKSLDVDFIKTENKKLKCDLKEIKNQNVELKQVEVKMENLALKNTILEQKVNSFENQLLQTREKLEDRQTDVAVVKGGIQDVKNMTKNNMVEINVVKDELQGLKGSLAEKSETPSIGVLKELRAGINDDFKKLDKSLNEKFEQHVSEGSKNVEVLKEHIRNAENIIFSGPSGKEVILHWKLQNYNYHFEKGEKVFSPMMFTQVAGYCFRFTILWNGINKENLEVGLKLHKGSDHDKILEPFNVAHTLEMQGKNGKVTSHFVRLEWIKNNGMRHFIIPSGENCAEGYGYGKFLTMPDLQDYIENDTISIRCRFSTP